MTSLQDSVVGWVEAEGEHWKRRKVWFMSHASKQEPAGFGTMGQGSSIY